MVTIAADSAGKGNFRDGMDSHAFARQNLDHVPDGAGIAHAISHWGMFVQKRRYEVSGQL